MIKKKKFPASEQEDFLMKFVKENMNIEELEIFKKEGNSIIKMEYDESNNQAIKTPCPN